MKTILIKWIWVTYTSFRAAGQSLLQVVKKSYNTEEIPEDDSCQY